MSLQIHQNYVKYLQTLSSNVANAIGHPGEIEMIKSDFVNDTIKNIRIIRDLKHF